MRVRLQSPFVVEPLPPFRGSRQQQLNLAPPWHKKWQRARCWWGFHYWAGWSYYYGGHDRQFRMCQRWAPDCITTDNRRLSGTPGLREYHRRCFPWELLTHIDRAKRKFRHWRQHRTLLKARRKKQ